MGQAEGWYADPFHRDQERYWNGRVWTQGTRPPEAAGIPAVDPTPTATPTSTEDGPVDGADAADARLAAAFARAGKVEIADVPPAEHVSTAEEKSFAPIGAPVRTIDEAMREAALKRVRPKKQKRRARHGMAGLAAVIVLVAGSAGAAFVLVGFGPAAAQEAVASAATQTMNSQSADMSLSIDVSVLGMHENVSANGAFDFAHQLGTMTMTIPVNGQQYSEQEIIDGSTVYVNVAGFSTDLLPTKPWVSESVSQVNSSSGGSNAMDPTAMLRQLQSVGGSVSSLGLTSFFGTPVTEYVATLPSSALMGDIGTLPSSTQQGVSGLNLPDMQMDIYITPDNLLKALVMPSYSVSFSGQTMSMDMSLVISNYGTPVAVTPPPADQVQPLLGNSGSTGNSGASI